MGWVSGPRIPLSAFPTANVLHQFSHTLSALSQATPAEGPPYHDSTLLHCEPCRVHFSSLKSLLARHLIRPNKSIITQVSGLRVCDSDNIA